MHPINLKGPVVFYIFQRLIHIFKDDFTKIQDNSRTKGTFFKFQEFSRTKVKFKDFSRSVQTLIETYMSAYVLLNLLNAWEKEIKCEACRAFYLFIATSLINSIIQEHEC